MGLKIEELHENVLLHEDIFLSSHEYGEINLNIEQGEGESSLRNRAHGARSSTRRNTRRRDACVGFVVPGLD
jgi:hypothetical protein